MLKNARKIVKENEDEEEEEMEKKESRLFIPATYLHFVKQILNILKPAFESDCRVG